ncbi:TPA: hypothetical protein ACOF4E_002376 [Staphylococcus aureus]|jgi:hypothetical protein|nr:hypothetical protein [Staphylococcus aureus]HDC7602888.1 hypothetical protein [Staphylococcus aureus]HEP1288733.1 hypothetical protein [Staphylococcus aureus]
MKKKDENNSKINKTIGIILVILALAVASIFLIFNNKNNVEKENNVLKNTNEELRKSNKEKENIIERLDKKNVDKEQKEARQIGEKFIKILFINKPKKELPTDKHDDAKKVMTNKLADKYFGKKDPIPSRYETDIKDINIYDDRYSPAKDNYKMFASFRQMAKEPDDSVSMQQDMVIELTLTQTKEGWKVKEFKQVAGQDNRSK